MSVETENQLTAIEAEIAAKMQELQGYLLPDGGHNYPEANRVSEELAKLYSRYVKIKQADIS